jgi:hypothetical protein
MRTLVLLDWLMVSVLAGAYRLPGRRDLVSLFRRGKPAHPL